MSMLSVDEMRNLLDQVEYKDGWRFSIYEHPFEGPFLRIEFDVRDSYNSGESVTLGINSFVPPCRQQYQFLDWLLYRIIRIEVHEAREFFKINGVPYEDPHVLGEPYDNVLKGL
jgi:hypothetical protein